jgi:hypothetical protein
MLSGASVHILYRGDLIKDKVWISVSRRRNNNRIRVGTTIRQRSN